MYKHTHQQRRSQIERSIQDIRRRLFSEGWVIEREGDHTIFTHPDKPGKRVTVPKGRGDLPIGTVRSIEKQAGWR
ncbi:type II toxin-antitoxin system HicA family toxin [Pleomorphomonas sp. JP5]|uniref:type II toxin-antitoxin system HicA family toxin n=1 Tax=Pleomorphomonas sp. JP5 TaxID=2942998 RepID=UPI00386207C7